MVTLIAAVDAALVTTEGLRLSGEAVTAWRATLIVLLLGSTAYQLGVQARNRVDRVAMDALYARLRNAAAIPTASSARVPIDEASTAHLEPRQLPLLHYSFLWAFVGQT